MKLKNGFTILLFSFLSTFASIELPLYKQTDHFKVYCLQEDHSESDKIAIQSETLFAQLAIDFNHHYSSLIRIFLYPDLQSFHQAINWPNAPDWVVGQTKTHAELRVSPRNPGPYHTAESIMKSNDVGLITLFISDKYPHNQEIPRWLHQGVGLYKAKMASTKALEQLAQATDLPTLEQLEAIKKEDNLGFNALNGFVISYSMVAFIDATWGWQAILKLLEDYAAFEQVLGLSKKEFNLQWRLYIKA